ADVRRGGRDAPRVEDARPHARPLAHQPRLRAVPRRAAADAGQGAGPDGAERRDGHRLARAGGGRGASDGGARAGELVPGDRPARPSRVEAVRALVAAACVALSCLAAHAASAASEAAAPAPPGAAWTHEIDVTIDPARHRLQAADRIVAGSDGAL